MGRGSLLHSTNIYYVLLRGTNCAWESELDETGMASVIRSHSLLKPTIPS